METYITIVHINEYAGCEAFRPGLKLRLRKEHDNCYDDEAVAVYGKSGARYGYVANSTRSVLRGTHSAGYIQHLFGEETECTVRFVSEEFAVAELSEGTETVI